MISSQLESPFFISEEEAVKIIEVNMEDLLSKINASSTLAQNSRTNATNIQPGEGCLSPGEPPCIQCNDPDSAICQCCLC